MRRRSFVFVMLEAALDGAASFFWSGPRFAGAQPRPYLRAGGPGAESSPAIFVCL